MDLRHGVFQRPGQSFQAIVRFSNSAETIGADGKVDARGKAIKLLDVDDTPAIPGNDNRCQDYLAVNLPVFPFATPVEYLKFFDIRATPLVGDPLAAAWYALFHPRHLTSVVKNISEMIHNMIGHNGGVSLFCGIGERCREGEELYREIPWQLWQCSLP